MSSALILFSNAQQSLMHASSAYIISYADTLVIRLHMHFDNLRMRQLENLEDFPGEKNFFFYVKDPNYFHGPSIKTIILILAKFLFSSLFIAYSITCVRYMVIRSAGHS